MFINQTSQIGWLMGSLVISLFIQIMQQGSNLETTEPGGKNNRSLWSLENDTLCRKKRIYFRRIIITLRICKIKSKLPPKSGTDFIKTCANMQPVV